MEPRDKIVKSCRELVAPLVGADGGELYLVSVTSDDVHIHLAGACAGCPGAALTKEHLLGPAISAVAPKIALTLTTGWRVPPGAEKIVP
ncbi:MAG: NifU family protein [Myxococcales bacterium]|nr:NifU family protein [Myxococcales bacterium]